MSGNSNPAAGAYDAFEGGFTSKPEVSLYCLPAHNILDADSPASLLPFMGGRPRICTVFPDKTCRYPNGFA